MATTNVLALRRGVLGATGLLVAVVITLLVTARLAGRHLHFDLPGRLGVDVSQTANGFTYSQSSKGHTLFTIHASKVTQYRADQARLHDVSILLYGPQSSAPTDKIRGSDFLYNRKTGVATAEGQVEIEMASPVAPAPQAAGKPAANRQPILIHTSALTFNQNTSNATTNAPVDFMLTNGTGHAVGASYNSKTGVLLLNSEVVLTSRRDNGIATVHAASAQFLRDTHLGFLHQASSEYGTEKSSADDATLHFRPDGSIEQLEAQNHVHVEMADGSEVDTSRANVLLDPNSQPVKADLFGGVRYTSTGATTDGKNAAQRSMHGNSVEATLDFVGKGELKHAQFRNAVSFVEQVQESPAGRSDRKAQPANGLVSSTREVRANRLDVDFSPSPEGKSVAQTALANGDAAPAVVVIHDIRAAAEDKTTTISGNTLLATLVDGHSIRELDGQGRTEIIEATPDGASSTSTGDKLAVKFVVTPKQAPRPEGDQVIESALQTGNVSMLQQPARSAKGSTPLRANAQQALFGGADQILHLSGDPHVTNGSLDMTADLIDYHRDTGDATARGAVKATYIQDSKNNAKSSRNNAKNSPNGLSAQKTPATPTGPSLGGQGPVHITADSADMKHVEDLDIFYGTVAAPARMWQGIDSVTAPVLELSRADQTLYAHGGPHDKDALVHATLTQQVSHGENAGQDTVTRVQGQVLHYYDKVPKSDPTGNLAPNATVPLDQTWRRADFNGSVIAEETTGVIHADTARIFLTPDLPSKPSQLDHLVALGHVVVTQPGRRGVGDKLVYTAADTRYVLTGTSAAPPRVTDAEKGTTTGAALIFRNADDSVEVAGDGSLKPSHTITDTHSPH